MTKSICTLIALFLLSTSLQSQTSNDSAKANKSRIEIDGKIYEKVEREAEFTGGSKAWTRYLGRNLNAYIPVKKKAPVGTYQVIVQFIVAKNGKVKDITAETTHGFGMEEEVIRIIKEGPKWVPAMQDGHPVNAYKRQPIIFVVSESEE